MRVAIIGPHKVGKTTLLDNLIPVLASDFIVHREIASDKRFEITESEGFFDYMHRQEKILEREIKIQKLRQKQDSERFNTTFTISDRSLIDNFAYMIKGVDSPYTFAFPGHIESNIKLLKDLSPIVSEAINNFNSYDLLFYIPIEFREGTPTFEQIYYQENIDEIIKYLLKTYFIDYHVIRGSVEERTQAILKIIKEE